MFIPNMLLLSAFAALGITLALIANGTALFRYDWQALLVNVIGSTLTVGLLVAAVIWPVQ